MHGVRLGLAVLLSAAAAMPVARAQQDDPVVITAPPAVPPRYVPADPDPVRRADPGAEIVNGIAGIVGGAAAIGGAIAGSAAGAFDAAATDAHRTYRGVPPLPPCDPGEPPYDVAGRHVCR